MLREQPLLPKQMCQYLKIELKNQGVILKVHILVLYIGLQKNIKINFY